MFNLGPLGQMPAIATYTLLTLGFKINNKSQQDAIESLLEKSARQLILAYPWLAGQVINEKSKSQNSPSSGTYKIVEYKPHELPSAFVRAKDCTHLCPSYSDISEAQAPLSMLDGKIISPGYGFPNNYPKDTVQPVILMQANFIAGGLLLTSCGHHCAMDANGHEQFLLQFASICRGESLLEDHVSLGNSNQEIIVPPLQVGEKILPLEMLRCPSSLKEQAGAWPPAMSDVGWKCFRFPAANIASLKVEASRDCSLDQDLKYVSSNDAVTTFIWTRLAAIRSTSSPQRSTMLVRAVNGRKKLDPPVSAGYMGHFIICAYTSLPVENILEDSFSATTIKVRKSLMEVDDHLVRSFFKLLQSEEDRSTFHYGAKFNPETDLMITSFVGQQLYSTSFGELLGEPDFIRRPDLPGARGLCYMMPKAKGGDVDIIISLSKEDFEGLEMDAKWRESVEILE